MRGGGHHRGGGRRQIKQTEGGQHSKRLNLKAADALKPPGSFFYEDPKTDRVRIFVGPLRRSKGLPIKGTDDADMQLRILLDWAWAEHAEQNGLPAPTTSFVKG